ncbi:MAG: aminotransferase class I/II-fold pyridoxal phosphate-dependent enzyme [Candidatus Omnitrophica bacterium]|nr:aminotransferase class I/II-fold pyridoxal phosphate-dependent enzyme [Candidatus Omnitrophota bacterium]
MIKKESINDLVIFGGEQAFREKLYVGCPNIGNRQRLLTRINEALDRRWLTNNGPNVQEFEKKVSEYIGVKHCIAVCNGTMGLEIASKAVALTGEVIVPSFTFVATAHALKWMGITPVFCDIDSDTYMMDPRLIEELITQHTTAIMGVHLWGRPCKIEEISQIADKHNLKVLFDAAHAFGATYKGKNIGNFGNAEVFSFHATKFLNTFEGGAIVTNDDHLALKIRSMKNFGFDSGDNVISLGINGKMNEISAAMGLTMLEDVDELIAGNYRHYTEYGKALAGTKGIELMSYDEPEKYNYQYIVLEMDEEISGVTRDQLVKILNLENVLVRTYFAPGCHNMAPYCTAPSNFKQNLTVTESLAGRVICLPTGSAITKEQINHICEIIRFVIKNGEEIKTRMDELQ